MSRVGPAWEEPNELFAVGQPFLGTADPGDRDFYHWTAAETRPKVATLNFTEAEETSTDLDLFLYSWTGSAWELLTWSSSGQQGQSEEVVFREEQGGDYLLGVVHSRGAASRYTAWIQ